MVASFSRALNFNSSKFELKSGQKYGHSNPKNVLKSDFQLDASSVGEGQIGWTVGLLHPYSLKVGPVDAGAGAVVTDTLLW